MNLLKEISQTCKECGTENFKLVMTVLHPDDCVDIIRQIVNKSLFYKSCRNCRELIHFKYTFSFHDPKNRFIVCLIFPREDGLLEPNNQIDFELARKVPKTYKTLIVINEQELIETIVCLKKNLDKRVLELYKLFFKTENNIDLGSKNELLHLLELNQKWYARTKLKFSIKLPSTKETEFIENINMKRLKSATNLITSLQPNLIPNTWYLINRNYPFGKVVSLNQTFKNEIPEYITLEIENNCIVLPRQYLELVQTLGKGRRVNFS